MPDHPEDAYRAARLVQWGLKSLARPAQEPEYRELIERYQDRSEYRHLVRRVAEGFDLIVLEVSNLGIVLGTMPDSVFMIRPSEFIPGSLSADERLLCGLIQIAIAARLYPRARDLQNDVTLARQPITVSEVEESLRDLCLRFTEEAKKGADVTVQDDLEGFYEAWRVYEQTVADRETKTGRRPRGTTQRLIEKTLERLCECGCFNRTGTTEPTGYQSTWKYQVLVQQLASSRVFQRVQSELEDKPGEE